MFELKLCFPHLCSNQEKTSAFEAKILCTQNQNIIKWWYFKLFVRIKIMFSSFSALTKRKAPLLNPKYSSHKIRKLKYWDFKLFVQIEIMLSSFSALIKKKTPLVNQKYSTHKIRRILNVEISNYLFELELCFPRSII